MEHLLGRRSTAATPRVRQFVAETALEAIAEAFDAEAVLLVRRDEGGGEPMVTSRFPPSWGERSGLRFELFGQLWRLLDQGPDRPPPVEGHHLADPAGITSAGRWRTAELGGFQLWMAGHSVDGGRLAAAIVRAEPLSPQEQAALYRVVRSVAGTVGESASGLPPSSTLSVIIDDSGPTSVEATSAAAEPDAGSRSSCRVDVTLAGDGPARSATAEGADVDLALAKAGVELAGSTAEVMFAGRTTVEDAIVSIVVLVDEAMTPSIGLALTPDDAPTGPIEAVFSAVRP